MLQIAQTGSVAHRMIGHRRDLDLHVIPSAPGLRSADLPLIIPRSPST